MLNNSNCWFLWDKYCIFSLAFQMSTHWSSVLGFLLCLFHAKCVSNVSIHAWTSKIITAFYRMAWKLSSVAYTCNPYKMSEPNRMFYINIGIISSQKCVWLVEKEMGTKTRGYVVKFTVAPVYKIDKSSDNFHNFLIKFKVIHRCRARTRNYLETFSMWDLFEFIKW